jgi:outer membrane protein assembly factor BamB
MDSLTATDLRTVGEFRLLARLGSGGMGQVFLASSLAGRIVAVKVIHAELCRDAEFVRRFRHEVEAAQKVSGWYTAPVVAAGVNDSPPWLATAFVSGPPLDDIVSRHGPLPVAAVWRLAAGLAEALRAIHGTGLVHRDLKPANVLLALDGPRVIDFGISRAVTDTRLTATGAIIGTLSYMSPEQVQAQATGPESDTFSLGSVLAFAAAGTAPFSGGPGVPQASVMYRIVHGEPELGAVPAEVRGLIEACLAKDPQHRPDLGRLAAYSTAAAERLGLSPAAFWPNEVAGVIQAQQAALAAQIEALRVAPSTQLDGAWPGSTRVPTPPGQALPSSAGPSLAGGRHSARHSSSAPATASGTGNGGTTVGGQAIPWQGVIARGTSRRGLLLGAGVGSIAVIGGAAGWALSSRSTPVNSPSAGTLPTGGSLPTQQSMQKYYGTGARRTAAWKVPTGNAIQANPGAGNGMAYVGSTDDNVYAVKIASGRRAWTYQAGTVTADPEVAGDIVCLSNSEGHFSALHVANGALAWELDTKMPATYKRTWAVNGGSVILARELAALQSYDAATGTKGVSFSTQEPYVMALSAADGVLYALDAAGILYAFTAATGSEIWHKQLLASDNQTLTGLTIDGGSIYLGTTSGTLYSVAAASGKVSWTYSAGSGMDSSPAAANGMVYLKDNNGNVQAVSAASGKKVWARGSVATGFAGVTAAAGRIYYSTALAIQALDAKSGAPVWAFTSSGAASGDGDFLSTPVVANGLVLVGCSDNSLYAIQA